jgi:hypothetical protein
MPAHRSSITGNTNEARVLAVLQRHRDVWLTSGDIEDLIRETGHRIVSASTYVSSVRAQLELRGQTVATRRHGGRWFYRIEPLAKPGEQMALMEAI